MTLAGGLTAAGAINANGGVNIPLAVGAPTDTGAVNRLHAAGLAGVTDIFSQHAYLNTGSITATGTAATTALIPGQYAQVRVPAGTHSTIVFPFPHWADLTENEQQGWIAVANTALPIIGKHALEDVRAYLGLKASGASTWWKKALYAAGAVIAGAILGGLGMSLSGCGHSVDVTPGRAEVCKDGSCLVIEQGHISYSQAQPETDVPPVVQVIPSKK